MALSNIFREPRREITETTVGILVFAIVAAPLAYADYLFAKAATKPEDFYFFLFLGLGIAVIVSLAGAMLFAVVHAIGQGICNALEGRGVHLRPRQRR
jgi:hypothetical protein